MNIQRLLTAAASSLGLVAGIPATSEVASASTPPVVVYSNVAGWSDSTAKPASIYVGQGGAPTASKLEWSHWTTSAYARGTLTEQANPGCYPTYLCLYVRYGVDVTLEHVKTHDGRQYFATVEWSWHSGGRHHVLWFVMSKNGFFNELG